MLTALLRCKSINIFIINLAVSNVLQLVVVAPIVTIDNLTEFFELGDIGCKSKFYLQTLFFIVPMLTISVISIDRQTCKRCLTIFRIEIVIYLEKASTGPYTKRPSVRIFVSKDFELVHRNFRWTKFTSLYNKQMKESILYSNI